MYQIYSLDPLYCTSTPGFTNKATLKMTSIEIKLITNLNMHLMIENGIRGGRYKPIYNNEKQTYIISRDANSLYASAMCYELQYEEIKFYHNNFKYTKDHIFNLNPYGEYLHVDVVDIDYPKNYTIEILNL